MSKQASRVWWLVEMAGSREWIEARGALPATVGALDRHRGEQLVTSDVEVFYATRVGSDRAVSIDASLAFQRAGWTSQLAS